MNKEGGSHTLMQIQALTTISEIEAKIVNI